MAGMHQGSKIEGKIADVLCGRPLGWFSFRFDPSCPSCLAKCKQRLLNIFVFLKLHHQKWPKTKNEKWDEIISDLTLQDSIGQNQSISNAKRSLETEVVTLRSEIEEMSFAMRNSEDKAKNAALDAIRWSHVDWRSDISENLQRLANQKNITLLFSTNSELLLPHPFICQRSFISKKVGNWRN